MKTELSPRQRQVVCCMAYGLTLEETAAATGMAMRTAKHHSDIARVRLGVRRREMLPAALNRAGEDPFEIVDGVDLSGVW